MGLGFASCFVQVGGLVRTKGVAGKGCSNEIEREGESPGVLCRSKLQEREEDEEEVYKLEHEKMQELTEDVGRYGERNRESSERNDVGRRAGRSEKSRGGAGESLARATAAVTLKQTKIRLSAYKCKSWPPEDPFFSISTTVVDHVQCSKQEKNEPLGPFFWHFRRSRSDLDLF